MHLELILSFCCFLLAMSTCLAAPQDIQTLLQTHLSQDILNRIASKNTLNYNDTCSFEDEKLMTAIGIKASRMVYDMKTDQLYTLQAEIDRVIRSTGNFCNASKILQCASNGHCECLNGDLMEMKLQSFRENDTCRLDKGSPCLPDKFLEVMRLEKPNLMCQIGSTCVLINRDFPCTEASMQQDLYNSYGGSRNVRGNATGFLAHVRKRKMTDGICFCGAMAKNSITYFIFGLLGMYGIINVGFDKISLL